MCVCVTGAWNEIEDRLTYFPIPFDHLQNISI